MNSLQSSSTIISGKPAATQPSATPAVESGQEPNTQPQESFIQVSMYPQDPLISKIETVQFSPEQFGKQLSGSRLKCQDRATVAKADENGNYHPSPGSAQFDQVNVYGVVAGTLLTYDHYMGHQANWNFSGPLLVRPHAGEGKTAYYQRQTRSINFCEWDSPSLGKRVKTSQALDIGAHETGHAILDGLRPGLLSGTESKAFHEGFGDSSAIVYALQFESNLEKILAENKGDFSKPSLITRLAEEFGTAFNKEDENPKNDDHPYYRTALNEFKYQDPKTLPSDSYPPTQPEEVLTSESHSFSRVWSGSFYSMLGSVYNQCAQNAPSQIEALRQARDVLGTVWGHSLDRLPASNLKFKQVAQAMLAEAKILEGGKYFNSFASVMVDRNLMSAEEVQQASVKKDLGLELASVPGLSRLAKTAEDGRGADLEAALQNPLSQVALAAAGWQADPVLEGANGRHVYTFRRPEQLSIKLDNGTPAKVQADSGITLVFGPQGELLDGQYTPLQDQDRAEVAQQAKELLRSGSRAVRLEQHRGSDPVIHFEPTWDA